MKEIHKRFLTSFLLLIIIYISFTNSIILFFTLIILSYYSLSEFNYLFKNIFKKRVVYHFFSVLACLVYIVVFSISVFKHLTPLSSTNTASLIYLLLICISTDVGGFIFGKLIGGKKLTKISPNKTYSGVFGSFLLSIISCYIFSIFLNTYLIFDINFFFLIIIISFISQFGDLMISFLKRKAKLKDTGSILPGHGGILDRIDGILLALPFGLILIST